VVEDGRVRLLTEKRPGIPAKLRIDEELAELLGYYCSEGWLSRQRDRPGSYRISLSFGRHERRSANRSARLIWKVFGLKSRLVESRTTVTVELAKTSLALLLRALCGSNAATKSVPEFLFRAPARIVEAFLRAFSLGDGCLTAGCVSLNTISEQLAMGLFGLYLRLGHLPSFNIYDPPGDKIIEGRRSKQSRLYYVKVRIERMREDSWWSAKHVRYSFADDYILVPIYRISRVPYSGPVFNLEVDDPDHVYTANFLAVGNCQNGDISKDKENGIPVTPELLALMAMQLRMEGCHNINFVGGEPTIHLHTIIKAISLLGSKKLQAKDLLYIERVKADYLDYFRSQWSRPSDASYEGEFNVPILWNSNFFMSEETMRILRTVVDVWLPDFKFGNEKCALRLSRTPWYFETVSKNHKLIYEWGEDMAIRHLIMPNHVECCTKPILGWIRENLPGVPVNIMDQYHPDCFADPRSPAYDQKFSDISRFPTEREILESFKYARSLGLCFEPLSYEKNMTGLQA